MTGCVFMPILADAGEIHPDASLVTVKVYDPAESPEMVVLVPLPGVVVPPGVLVNVQVPVAGKPFNITLPVDNAHVGWVMVPTIGADGTEGWAFMTTFPDAIEVQVVVPSVTVKL